MLWDLDMTRVILFLFTWFAHFCNDIHKCQLYKSLKYFSTLWPMKSDVRFEHISCKNVWFCFISIVWVYVSHKTKEFRFWKSLKYFYFLTKKISDFDKKNALYGRMSDFVSFLLFRLKLVIKLKNFYFETHWNTLIFLIKNIWCQIWICPMEKCLIFLHFYRLGSL